MLPLGVLYLRGHKKNVLARVSYIVLLLVVLLPCSTSRASAQSLTTGGIAGTVSDPSGAAVPKATVTLKNLSNGSTQIGTTNDQGAFTFSLLQPGDYTVQAKVTGLQSDTQKISVQVGQTPNLTLTAKVQNSQTIVEVTSQAGALQVENANLTATFNTQQIHELPAPGGDLTTIAFTVPGIAENVGMGGYGNFSSHGLPGTSNLFTINGDDYNDAYLNLNNSGASNLLLGQNEVSEASVTQNGYSVQYGRQAGAQANYVTKGGTNAIHADLLFNFNNHLMNGNDFFNNANGTPRPYDVSRQWGADIGGPILKNRLFFYSDSEGLYYSLPTSGVVNIPSPQLQAYMTATLSSAELPLYQKAFAVYNGAKGAVPVTTGSGLLQDPSGNLGCGDFAGTPGLGSEIFGVDTPCMSAFRTNGLNTNKEWLETHRVDWNINDKQKIYFRFKGDHGFQPTGTNLLNSTLNLQSIQPQYEGQINHTYVINPTTVNNAVVSVLWYSAIFGPASVSAASGVFPTYFGFSGGNTGGDVGATGLYGAGVNWNSFPQGRDVGQFQAIDDLSKVMGNHTLKFGVNFRKNRVTDFSYYSNQIGTYNFTSLTDFITGNLVNGSYYSQKFSPLQDAHIRLYNIGVYAQDEWNITPSIKLTYGLRLDRTANPTCLDDCFSRLTEPFTSSGFQTGTNIPYNASIETGLSHAYYNVQPVVWNPRVGVVFTVPNHPNTVIRGGFGEFADLFPAFIVSNIFNNPPNPYNAFVTNGTLGLANVPGSSASIAAAQYAAFSSGFKNGATFDQLNAAIPGGFSPLNVYSIPQTFKTPQYLEWSFEIEQRFGQKNVLTMTYSGNHGYNLLTTSAFANAQIPGGLLANITPVDPRFGTVAQYANDGRSNYDGLTVSYRRTLSYGFSGQVGYTWSHALDTISNGGAGEPYDFCSGCSFGTIPFPNASLGYGNADYDIRHNLVADFLWDTPWKFNNKWIGNILGNWTLSGKVIARTGTPFSVINGALPYSVDPTHLEGFNSLTLTGYSVVNGLPATCGAGAVNTACLSTTQLAPFDTQATLGNLGRNAFMGPNYVNLDLTLFKNFNVTERMRFQLGASAYNSLNHPNFQNPVADISAPGFGLISSTAIPPTSAYGSFQGSAVSGRVLVITGKFMF